MRGTSDFAAEENADQRIRGRSASRGGFFLYIRVGEINGEGLEE